MQLGHLAESRPHARACSLKLSPVDRLACWPCRSRLTAVCKRYGVQDNYVSFELIRIYTPVKASSRYLDYALGAWIRNTGSKGIPL